MASTKGDRRELCLSWDELKPFAGDPLVGIGAHTISHCNLAKQTVETPSGDGREPRADRERSAAPVLHLAYPYGDRVAAGAREFTLARAAGFKTAVTTRPGMIFRRKCGTHDRAAARLAQRQLPGRTHAAGADLRRRNRDVERFSPVERRNLIPVFPGPHRGG